MKTVKLIVTDIDNTLFDWVNYYVHSFETMLNYVRDQIEVEVETLQKQASAVFSEHASIEYPFVIQELPAVIEHFGADLDGMLKNLVDPARKLFRDRAVDFLQAYDGVPETLAELKKRYPGVPLVALTDAPRYVAMWKLNKLDLLNHFDAVYGLADPRLPTDDKLGRVKVDPKILLKHLQQTNFNFTGKIRILPEEYEKPGTRGLKTVLMDYNYDETNKEKRSEVLWIGDNLRKDVGLGNLVGVTTIWAKYGTQIKDGLLDHLNKFSPQENIAKNVNIDPAGSDIKPDFVLERFADVLEIGSDGDTQGSDPIS